MAQQAHTSIRIDAALLSRSKEKAKEMHWTFSEMVAGGLKLMLRTRSGPSTGESRADYLKGNPEDF